MDEISRELPPDTTTSNEPRDRQKGPEELVAFERGQVAENLVVRGRFTMPVDPMSVPEPNDAAASDDNVSAAQPSVEQPSAANAEEVEAESVPLGIADPAVPAVEQDVVEQDVVEHAAEPVASEPLAEQDHADQPQAEQGNPEQANPEQEHAEQANPEQVVAADEAAAAVAAEAEVAAIEEEIEHVDEEGLPPAPELTDAAEVAKVVYVLMLTSREGLSLLRLAQACNTTQKLVAEALELLQQQMRSLGLPVELARSGDTVKWMSGASAFVYLQRLRGVKKLEKLSPAALETLAVIAYRQPVMRSEIEAIRGVKAGPMLRTLLQHKLVCCTGRADVPGKPLQYGTTQQFLDRFGLASLQELPSVKEWKNLG